MVANHTKYTYFFSPFVYVCPNVITNRYSVCTFVATLRPDTVLISVVSALLFFVFAFLFSAFILLQALNVTRFTKSRINSYNFVIIS